VFWIRNGKPLQGRLHVAFAACPLLTRCVSQGFL
jgi:hypothetical protein